jgi:cyclophilin family peptidyl-prolyl cis-trans isomerase
MKIRALLIILIVLLPGCLDWDSEGDSIDPNDNPIDDSMNNQAEGNITSYSNITLNIFHGEDLENATANYTIRIMLNHSAAPLHSDNMYKHVVAGNFNMTHFHRIIDDFMIQGGDFENHDGTGGYAADWYGVCNGNNDTVNESDCPNQVDWNVPDEADNGLQHLNCTISMAKTSQPNTAGSQFFLMPDDISHHSWLDGVHTVFGEITEGCEHVTTISQVATDGYDRPVTPVIIYSAVAND